MEVKYEGHDQLSIMSYAKRYNKRLYNFISKDINNIASVLDFGSGIGEFSNRFSNQERISVIELDEAQLQMNSTKNKFKSIDALQNRKFDFIYSLNVLEHIEDDKEIVKQLSKHLNVGGEFRIFVPAKMILYTSMDRAVGHFRRYEKNELLELFQLNGLKIQSIKYFDFLGYFITLLYKYIGDKNGNISKNSILIYDKIIFPISTILDIVSFGQITGKNIILSVKKIS